jgi:hypothetical protein
MMAKGKMLNRGERRRGEGLYRCSGYALLDKMLARERKDPSRGEGKGGVGGGEGVTTSRRLVFTPQQMQKFLHRF